MRVLKSTQKIIPYGVGLELLGISYGGVLILVGLVVMSISIVSMLAFACAHDGKPKEKPGNGGRPRPRTRVGGGLLGGDFAGDEFGGASGGCGVVCGGGCGGG